MLAALENGEIVTAHCTNTGSMIRRTTARSYISRSENLNRKLLYTWGLTETNSTWGQQRIPCTPNKLVPEAVRQLGVITD